MNVLYDKDHYKIALGQIHVARDIIGNISRDYVRMLKYVESLYRAKQLKRAALGRMCTTIHKIRHALGYLEQVRQHLARLPSIDPTAKTLMVCGFPNVGKSTFVNKISRANVDVQPYAFTTKSLLLGHMDYKYARWQVMDTPGILDHPLEERNTIEMQSITALAHLNCSILYFVDVSEQNYHLEEQCSLFRNIKPLFAGKPLILVLSKIDLRRPEELQPERAQLIADLARDLPPDTTFDLIPMSSHSEEGVTRVKETACERLLALQESLKGRSRSDDILNRLHVAQPQRRDDKDRGASIPASVLRKREEGPAAAMVAEGEEEGAMRPEVRRELEKERYTRLGPKYRPKWEEQWELENPDWAKDPIPELFDGHAIVDFVDPEIERRLEELEKEEEALVEEAARLSEAGLDVAPEIDSDMHVAGAEKLTALSGRADQVARKNQKLKKRALGKKRERTGRLGADGPEDDEDEADMHPEGEEAEATATEGGMAKEEEEEDLGGEKKRHAQRRGRETKRARSSTRSPSEGRGRSVGRAMSKAPGARSKSRPARDPSRLRLPTDKPVAGEGLKNMGEKVEARKKMKAAQKLMTRRGNMGESDRLIPTEKPRHLFAGKRGLGKHERR
eukprot:GAFH01000933.1.p1 GENE.GAFH01000933.1~~GAFH01000933.1.p1  ORF type:complete len:708 (-),score=321.92 GAFH01000933.1:200-2059(-)